MLAFSGMNNRRTETLTGAEENGAPPSAYHA